MLVAIYKKKINWDSLIKQAILLSLFYSCHIIPHLFATQAPSKQEEKKTSVFFLNFNQGGPLGNIFEFNEVIEDSIGFLKSIHKDLVCFAKIIKLAKDFPEEKMILQDIITKDSIEYFIKQGILPLYTSLYPKDTTIAKQEANVLMGVS